MPVIDSWFYEENHSWDGQSFGFKVLKRLYQKKTQYQNLEVYSTSSYGNMLVLDGVVQMTERDEFAYQEMICHIPLTCHQSPRKVLVIGGGDGGCVREILKHNQVKQVDLVEIDEAVIENSKKFFPKMSESLSDPRLSIHICDGFEYLTRCQKKYDIIISDSSDPEGPAAVLFQEKYFRLLSNVLDDDGLISLQASENIWLDLSKLHMLYTTCTNVFPVVKFSSVCVPSYTSGQLGILVCGKSPSSIIHKPLREWTKCSEKTNFYYNADIHQASFIVPNFAKKYVGL